MLQFGFISRLKRFRQSCDGWQFMFDIYNWWLIINRKQIGFIKLFFNDIIAKLKRFTYLILAQFTCLLAKIERTLYRLCSLIITHLVRGFDNRCHVLLHQNQLIAEIIFKMHQISQYELCLLGCRLNLAYERFELLAKVILVIVWICLEFFEWFQEVLGSDSDVHCKQLSLL